MGSAPTLAVILPGSCNVFSVLFADLLAVPKHPYAAMENWGLSVFVEQKILLDAEVSSSSYQMELTMVVVHEICHQVGTGWVGSSLGKVLTGLQTWLTLFLLQKICSVDVCHSH